MDAKQSTLPMWKYSMVGFLGVIVLNIVARVILRLSGSPVSVAIGFAVGGAMAMWFAMSERRVPTLGERSRFLWQYSVAIALFFGAATFLASRAQGLNVWSLLTVVVNWAAYPICAYLYMSERYFGKTMKRLFDR